MPAGASGGWNRGCIALDIVERPSDQVGFQVLPRRWVVERTLCHPVLPFSFASPPVTPNMHKIANAKNAGVTTKIKL